MDDRIKILKLTPLFANQGSAVLEDAAKRIKEEHFEANQVICRTGQIGSSMYMIKSGEVKVLIDSEKDEIVLDYLGRGKYFGEMSLLTGGGRSASVVATLDSILFVLEKQDFEDLIKKYPAIAVELSRVLAERLTRINSPKPIRRHPPKLINFMSPLDPEEQKYFSCMLARAIAEESGRKVIYLDFNYDALDILTLLKRPHETREQKEHIERLETITAHEFEKYLPSQKDLYFFWIDKEILQQKISHPHYMSTILGLIKERFDFIIVDCGRAEDTTPPLNSYLHSKFTEISDVNLYYLPGPKNLPYLNRFLKRDEKTRNKTEIIAQKIIDSENPEIVEIYNRAEKLPAYRFPVYRESLKDLFSGKSAPGELGRLARRIAGVSIALAIGSGGVRSCSAIGFLDELRKAGIEIDMLAGSSMGSVVATLFALGRSTEDNISFNKTLWSVKYPLSLFPLSNILNPRKSLETARKIFPKNFHLEELNLPVFVAAADVVSCREVVFEMGPIIPILTASVSIPALFPPVRHQSMWLIDGGVANMVPGDILKEKNAGITIGINVNGADLDDPEGEKKRLQSNNVVFNYLRMLPFMRKYLDAPSLPNIINRSIYIPNLILTRAKMASFDFFIEPDVFHYRTFDAASIETIVEEGRKKAAEIIPNIKNRIKELTQK